MGPEHLSFYSTLLLASARSQPAAAELQQVEQRVYRSWPGWPESAAAAVEAQLRLRRGAGGQPDTLPAADTALLSSSITWPVPVSAAAAAEAHRRVSDAEGSGGGPGA